MAESFRCCVVLPLDREWIPAKSIGRLVGDAVVAYLAEKHVNDEAPEDDADFDPVAEAQFAFGFNDKSTEPTNVRRAILACRAAGQIVVREADGFGVIRDDNVMRGVLTREDLAKLLTSEWRIDLMAPPSAASDAEPLGSETPAEPRELEPVPWEPQDVAGLVRVALVLEQAVKAEQTPAVVQAGRLPKTEAPEVATPTADDTWRALAQTEAKRIIQQDAIRGFYPPQLNIADRIAADFRSRKPPIVGYDGKPLTGATIKRHALKGIDSAVKKAQSTKLGRSK